MAKESDREGSNFSLAVDGTIILTIQCRENNEIFSPYPTPRMATATIPEQPTTQQAKAMQPAVAPKPFVKAEKHRKILPTKQSIDKHAAELSAEVRQSVYIASKLKTEKRVDSFAANYDHPDELRYLAGAIKQHTLDHLEEYLVQAEAALKANGAEVHWATDGESANRIILEIMQRNDAKKMVKSKSMVSEETELVPYLEKHGIEAIETDLGEFIVQIDGDHPSHIVTPIIHKNRRQIAESFEKHGLGEYNDDPTTITRRARKFLREKYFQADVGMTGANFVIAETGRIVTVTNEGNGRFSCAAPKIHIALVGIEKLVPKEEDMAVFLSVLARSATAQNLTVYTQFIGGPKPAERPHGSEQMHVVFVDNRRSEVLASDVRKILRCIRCGACMNVCPVYRQASGHAYRKIYPGPVGIVLAPMLEGEEGFAEYADLPKASSLCGACNEVCPVDIPIPELILRNRNRAHKQHLHAAAAGTPPMGGWAMLASSPMMWKTSLSAGRVMNAVPRSFLNIAPPAAAWQISRDLPEFKGGSFRKWLKKHKKEAAKK